MKSRRQHRQYRAEKRGLAVFIPCLLALCCPQGAFAGDSHFYCRYKPPQRSYWDRLMVQREENGAKKLYPIYPDPHYRLVNSGEQDMLLFSVYKRHAPGKSSYMIYTYDPQTRTYIMSRAHYVTRESYRRDFSQPLTRELQASYYRPELFALIPERPASGQIPIGWNKTRWQCEQIGTWRYFREYLRMFFIGLSSAIS